MGAESSIRRQYLEAMGILAWARRMPVSSFPADTALPSAAEAEPALLPQVRADPGVASDWSSLQHAVATCTKCVLHQKRRQTVFGTGDLNAAWLFIGEAPGAEEDRQGEPFVGPAGKLLNEMLFALGIKRKQVYIANVLKCRPPNNRDPRPEEVEMCEPYLIHQIALIQPQVIIALGRHAAHSLLRTELPLGRLRARRLSYQDTPLVVTYHPAYLLRNPIDKRKVWQDLCLARSIVERA